MRRALLLSALLLAPAAARALPPVAVVEVKAGTENIVRLYDVRALRVADPSVVAVEVLPATGELLISGKAAGATDVAAWINGRVVAIRVLVRAEGKPSPGPTAAEAEALLASAKKACPGLKVEDGLAPSLYSPSPSPACRKALGPLLATGRFPLKTVEVEFEPPGLQLQLVEVEAALKAAGITGLKLHYQGASLVAAGHLTHEEAGRVALALYQASLGGIPVLDDELEFEPQREPDAGQPEAPAVPASPTSPTSPESRRR